MKKRILPLFLALTLCASLMTPAFALDQTIQYEPSNVSFTSTYTIKNATRKLDSPIRVWNEDEEVEVTISKSFEGDFNTVITVGGMSTFSIQLLELQSDGVYHFVKGGTDLNDHIDNHVEGVESEEEIIDRFINSESGKEEFSSDYWYKGAGTPTTEDFKAYILDCGDSIWRGEGRWFDRPLFTSESYYTFTKPGIYLIYAVTGSSPMYHDPAEYCAALLIGGTAPDAPAVPTVSPSPCKGTLDKMMLTLNAYLFQENGGGANYVMLRDVAQLLNGTKAQFEVSWDKDKGIVLTTGQAYTPAGNELQSKGDGDKPYTANASTITVDGKAVELNAYTIEGNNYFKLRDLGAALGFNVGWDGATGTVTIDSTQPYSGAN